MQVNNEILLRMNEDGVFEEYEEPYATIECQTKEDFEGLQRAVEKQNPKKPFKESLADRFCVCCGAYINFDALNGKIEHAPKYCHECGQKIDWSDERNRNERKNDLL